MTKSIHGLKIAILAASGFDQNDMTAAQRAMTGAGAHVRVISPDQGLINGWDGNGWGHNFAVDAALNTALGVDYDGLIVPGGRRSLEKLLLTAHTKRFIGSFLAAFKPVALMGDAVQVLISTGQAEGRTVAGPAVLEPQALTSGANWSQDAVCTDGILLSGVCDEATRDAYISTLAPHFADILSLEQAA